jgi:lysozyme family protein
MPVYDAAGEFTRSLPKILTHEGLYSNNPADPGGATMKGVTQRVFSEWLRANGQPSRDVRTITDAELTAIYRKRYWDIAQLDKLAHGVSYVVFDGNVNSGVSQSVKWLQRALQAMGLYQGAIDGIIGQGTILAAGGVNDNDVLIARIIERREAFLRSLTTFKTFGKGWLKRIADVKAVGQAWATGSVGPEISYAPGGDAKAFLSSAKPAPSTALADAATGGGGGSFTLGSALAAAQDKLTPFQGSSHIIDNLIVGLIVGGLVVGAGSYGIRWYQNRRRAERADALDLQAVTNVQAAA